jgi:hypothetical protein
MWRGRGFWTLGALLLAGCGRVGFDALGTSDGAAEAAIDAETFFDASPVCGSVPFNDGFDDGVPGLAWAPFENAGVMIREQNSRLEIVLPTVATAYGWYGSTCQVDNRDRALTVRIGELVSNAPGVQMYSMITLDAQNTIGIQYQQGSIASFRRVADVYNDVDVVPYDPARHRYWRIGGAAGNVTWELSGDGVAWELRNTEPAPFDLSATEYRIVAGLYVDAASPGVAAFDEVSVR